MGENTVLRAHFALLAAGFVASLAAFAQTQSGPALSVDAAAARHPISPDIYGFNWYLGSEADFNNRPDISQAPLAADLRIGIRRWGGNNMSRYHWKFDVWNIDSDWFFEVLPDNNPNAGQLPEGSRFNAMVEYSRITGSKLMGTIPIMGWLPKARQKMCSFSVAKYGAQQQVDQYWDDCGNGVRRDGTNITGNDPHDANAESHESFQADWVKYVVSKYGPANQGGVAVWSLDNEPVWWSGTHRDIHPQAQTYDETLQLGLKYARAVKAADPTALVSGPVSAGWGSFFFSLSDMNAGWARNGNFWSNPTDRRAHGNIDISSWYLQQFRQAEARDNRRLLDYFDLHMYDILPDPMNDTLRLQSTRVLWDPQYLSPNSYWGFDEQGNRVAPRLVPRMRDWVNQNYPGTKTALTEYSWGALGTIVGGIAQADALGIFGREGLDLATLWATLKLTDPAAFAFRLYRNYDGIGGSFGETSVQAATADPDQLAIFAAQRSDSALTVIVLNKTTAGLSSAVSISNFTPAASAEVWRYSQADLTRIVRQPDAAVSGNAIGATFPAYSMTLFVVPPAASGPAPVVAAVTNAASYESRIAPGQMVVVWGTALGPAQLQQLTGAPNNMVATELAGTRILFDGVPAPIVYVSATQCSAVVPYFAALKSTAHVQVEYRGRRSAPLEIAISPAGPALFTASAQGSGQGAIQNSDGRTPNSAATPAARGDLVVLWLTGEGVTNPPGVDGRLAIDILPKPVATVAVTIGGLPAAVEYAGAAPYNMPGLMQINARIDAGVQPGNDVPVLVTIGGATSKAGVTLAVR